jgi:hypothetical protein
MIAPLLFTFVVVCALLLLRGMVRRGAIYEYPFLAGAVFTGFALPQFAGLVRDPFLPSEALETTLVMAILSAAMCWLGSAIVRRPLRSFNWHYNEGRLLMVSIAFSLLGGYFYYAISRLPVEMTENTQWTGLPVAYLFFARLLTYGFALSVLIFARNGSRVALLVALYGGFFYFDRIVIGGRRQDLVEFLLIILLSFLFQRNWCVPRLLMLAGLVMGALYINSIGEYRSATMDPNGPRWDAVSNIDLIGNLDRVTEQGGAELRNAVYNIGAISRNLNFDFGLYHWNALVFSYVPAQIVGRDLKESLYLPLPEVGLDRYSYSPPLGSTSTGLSDAFQSFWYFGCLKFFFIAFIMQKLLLAAREGNLTAQLLYALLPAYALEAITHTTQYFLGPWVHLTMFLLPALLLARQGSGARQRGRGPAPIVLSGMARAGRS